MSLITRPISNIFTKLSDTEMPILFILKTKTIIFPSLWKTLFNTSRHKIKFETIKKFSLMREINSTLIENNDF